ncbi:MAG: glutamate--tRNA ligase, partial [Rhodocyclaceae bacterium]|nr:glutamate--tRNA ligase [Rhodocyclaceae bacterium]
ARLGREVARRLGSQGVSTAGGPVPERLAALYKDRVGNLNELADAVHAFYVAPHATPELKAQHMTAAALAALGDLRGRLAGAEWSRESLNRAIKETVTACGLKMPQVAIPLRVALLGQPQSPSIDGVLEVLGREAVLARLDAVR